jgi:hypothetical protein
MITTLAVYPPYCAACPLARTALLLEEGGLPPALSQTGTTLGPSVVTDTAEGHGRRLRVADSDDCGAGFEVVRFESGVSVLPGMFGACSWCGGVVTLLSDSQ